MEFADIHCHALYGVDDGAEDEAEMRDMLDAMYRDGIKTVCFTPHFNPGIFPPLADVKKRHFEAACDYVAKTYPDMKLFLGSELFWHNSAIDSLLSGECFTLAGTRRVLVEFSPYDDPQIIRQGVTNLLTSGFIPVVAHVERYAFLCKKPELIRELRDLGAYIQVNAASVTGGRGFFMKRLVFGLIRMGLVDIVADDCHNIKDKSPGLSAAYSKIKRKFGQEVAEDLFVGYPMRVIS